MTIIKGQKDDGNNLNSFLIFFSFSFFSFYSLLFIDRCRSAIERMRQSYPPLSHTCDTIKIHQLCRNWMEIKEKYKIRQRQDRKIFNKKSRTILETLNFKICQCCLKSRALKNPKLPE